jgi:hypothetical protein
MSIDRNPMAGSLAELQAGFAQALRSFDGRWPSSLLGLVVPGGTLDAAGALAVYRRGYVARLPDQLGETYAAVGRVLGDDDFFAACDAFVAGHDSVSYNLSDYGRDLPAFLETSPVATGLAFLSELAAFELAFHDLFHGPDHEAADVSEAAALAASGDLSGVRLRFGEAVRLMALRHATYDLFVRRHDEDAPDVDVHRPQWMMLFRQRGEVRALEVGAGTFAALDALARGRNVEEALEEAAGRDPAFGEADASALFGLLVSCGVVVDWRA